MSLSKNIIIHGNSKQEKHNGNAGNKHPIYGQLRNNPINVTKLMYTLQSTAHENHTQGYLFTLTLHTTLISLLVWSSSPQLYFRGGVIPDVDKVQGVGLIQTCMQTAM